jgi:WD40 repeat protein
VTLAVSSDRSVLVLESNDPQHEHSPLTVVKVDELARDPQVAKPLPAEFVQARYGLAVVGEHVLGVRQENNAGELLIARVSDGSLVARIPVDGMPLRGFYRTDMARRRVVMPRPWNRSDASQPPKFCVVELASGKVLGEFAGYRASDGEAGPFAFSPDGQLLAFLSQATQQQDGSRKAHVAVWSAGEEQRQISQDWNLPPFGYVPWNLSFCGPDRLAIVGPEINKETLQHRLVFELWDIQGPKLLYASSARPGSVSRLRQVGKTLAIDYQPEANNNSNLRCELLSMAEGRILAEFPGRRSLRMSLDKKHLLLDMFHAPPETPGQAQPAAPQHLGAIVVEMATGNVELNVEGFSGRANFTPDGDRLLVLSQDQTGRGSTAVWDLAARQKRTLPALLWGTDYISPDGRLAFSYDEVQGPDLQVWDLASGTPLRKISLALPTAAPGKMGPSLISASWSADSKRLAANVNGQVRLMEIEGSLNTALPRFAHTGNLSSVAVSTDGRLLASGSNDRTIGLWNAQDGQFAGLLEGYASGVTAVAFHPTAPVLYGRDADGEMLAWRLEEHSSEGFAGLSGKLLWRSAASSGRTLTASHNGDYLATNGPDGSILLLATKDGATLHKLAGVGQATGLAFSPNDRLLAATGPDSKVRLWSVADGKPAGEWHAQQGELGAIIFSPDGELLATGGVTIRLWRVKDQTLLLPLEQHTKVVRGLAFTSDGKQLISAGDDRLTVTWDISNLKAVLTEIGLGW